MKRASMRRTKQLLADGKISFEFPPPDEDGYTGRECPECESYFKITFGTGLEDATDHYCPYCEHQAGQDHFWTQAQLDYIRSVVQNKLTKAVIEDFKALEFKYKPRGFGLGLSLQVKGKPTPIRYYREETLETEIVCDQCSLRYAVYGVFAVCPDCGVHNSHQILDKNLELVRKELELAKTAEGELVGYLIADALENIVSAFDGFGREVCRVHAASSSNPTKAGDIRFQSLSGAQKNVQQVFGFDIAKCLTIPEWEFTCRCFQKRHLLSHTMGVIDDEYIKKTNDPDAVKGRKISVTSQEVTDLVETVKKLGTHLVNELEKLTNSMNSTGTT